MIKIEEEVLREFLCLLVSVTLELQDRLRTMFLPTAERCHYIFNMKDIGTVFRFANLKLTVYVGLLFSKAISWGRKWQLCVVLICHDYYEITMNQSTSNLNLQKENENICFWFFSS